MPTLIHTVSHKQLDALKRDRPQSLLITGSRGIGTLTVSKYHAGSFLAGVLQPQNAKGEVDEQGTISVEAIRDLYTQTRAKFNSPQIYIIDNAERMSSGAQSAFLKLLEEPTKNTYFILTSHAPQKLLPTIRSRVQQVILHPLSFEQTTQLMAVLNVADATRQSQLRYIAQGLPAELHRLVESEEYFSSRAAIVTDARTFLKGTPYEKLIIIQKYQSDRSGALQLIDSAMQILHITLRAKADEAIIRQLETLLAIRENIAAQYNIRLQLAGFVL